MLGFVGKVLIVTGLCFQAYLLFDSATISNDFDQKLQAALTVCDCIPKDIAIHIMAYARFVVIGLLASSILMLISSVGIFKIFIILGLSTILYIQHQPFNKVPCFCQNIDFWTKIAFIGGMMCLLASECPSGKCGPCLPKK